MAKINTAIGGVLSLTSAPSELFGLVPDDCLTYTAGNAKACT